MSSIVATYGRSDSRSPPPGSGSRSSPPRANMQRSQHGQAPRRYERQAAPNFLTGQDGIQPDIEAVKAATEEVVVATINEAVEMVAVERTIASSAVDAATEALVVATIDEAIDVVVTSAWTKARDLKSRISAAAAFMEIQDEKRFIGSGLTACVVLRTSLGAPYGDEPNGMLYERLPLVGKEKRLVLPSRGEIIIADGELQIHISDQVGNPVRSLLLAYGPLNPHTTSLSSADGNLEVEIQPYLGTSEPIFGLGEIRIKLPGNVLQKALNRPPPPGALTPAEREKAMRRVSTGRAATSDEADEAARADGRGVSMTRMSRLSTASKREGSDGSGGEARPQSQMSLSDDVPRTSTALRGSNRSGSSRRNKFKAVSKTAVGAKSMAAAGDERWLRRAVENAATKPDAPGGSAADAAGALSGFVFRDGEFGLGYYDDSPAADSDAAAAPAAAAEAGQPWAGVAAPTPAAPVADGVGETHLAYESHEYVTHLEVPLGPRASTTRGGGRRYLKAALPKAAAATTMAKLGARRAAAKGGGAAAALDAAVAAAGAAAAGDDDGDGSADGARGAAHSLAERPPERPWSPGGLEGLPPPPSPADPVEDEPHTILWAPSPSPPSAPKQDAGSVGDDERRRNDVANLPRLPMATASRPPTGRESQSARGGALGRREAAAAAAASELSAPFSARLSRRADLSADSVSQDVSIRARSPRSTQRLRTQEPLAPALAVAAMQVRPQYASWVHEGASSMDKASGRGQEGARRTMAKLLNALHERTAQSEWNAPDLALLWGARDLHKGGEGALLAAIETRLGSAAAAAFAAAVAASGISALPLVAPAPVGSPGAWRHMPVVASADRPASSLAPASITERPITCEVSRLPAKSTPRAVMTAALLTPRYMSTAHSPIHSPFTAHSPRENATRTATAEGSMVAASALEAAAPSAARISLPLRGMSQVRSDQLRCTPRKAPEPDVGGFQLPNMPHFQAKGRLLVTAGAKFGVASSLALANQLARRPAELQAFPPPPPPPPMYGYY